MSWLRYTPLIWLRFLPTGPSFLIGIAFVLLATVPAGDLDVIYLGSGVALLGIMRLAVIPMRELTRYRNRVYWPASISLIFIVAFVLPPIGELLWIGIAFFVAGSLSPLAAVVYEDGLSVQKLIRDSVRHSGVIDYAALFDVRDGVPVRTDACYADRRRIEWQMRRFALPGTPADQVAIWDAIAAQLYAAVSEMDKNFASSGQGENGRVVFDIDMGGMFFTRIHRDRFLFAVTLDQTCMNDNSSDRAVRRLVRQIALRTSTRLAGAAE